MQYIISTLENIKRLQNIVRTLNNLPSPGVNVACKHCGSKKAFVNSADMLQCSGCNLEISSVGWCLQITDIMPLPNQNEYALDPMGLDAELIVNAEDKAFAEDMLANNLRDLDPAMELYN